MNDIGLIIKKIREEKKLSQLDFSSKIGISRSSLSQIEIGKVNPTFEILYNIANIFCINGNVFFLDKETEANIIKNGPCELCKIKDRLIKSQEQTIELLRKEVERHQKRQCDEAQQEECRKNERRAG